MIRAAGTRPTFTIGRRTRRLAAMDDRDRIWVVETGVQPNLMVGFDTKTEQVFSVTEIPSGGGSVRHMDYHRGSQTVWFGADTSTIGRAVLE